MKPIRLEKIRLEKIRDALRNTVSWPATARRLKALTAPELDEAEKAERRGRRRINMLRQIGVERDRRAGITRRTYHPLKVEASL